METHLPFLCLLNLNRMGLPLMRFGQTLSRLDTAAAILFVTCSGLPITSYLNLRELLDRQSLDGSMAPWTTLWATTHASKTLEAMLAPSSWVGSSPFTTDLVSVLPCARFRISKA